MKGVARDLVAAGLLLFLGTTLEYLHSYRMGFGLVPIEYWVYPGFGVFLIVSGLFGRTWRSRWRARRRTGGDQADTR